MELQLWREMLTPYELAVDELVLKFRHIIREYRNVGRYSPIEQVDGRVKSISSILDKMQRKKINVNDVEKELEDIAGIRVICHYIKDIYRMSDLLLRQDDIHLLKIKDYIKNPKENGYRSLHLVVEVPVYLANEKVMVPVEIQIRTIAMDFWASLEHKIRYKFEGKAPQHINEELKACSDIVNMLDAKMLSLNEEVQALPKVGVEEHHEENVRMQKMWEENKIVDKLQKK